MNGADHTDRQTEPRAEAAGAVVATFASLKPKGACWYCNHPLDNVRRFCNKACADDYRIEEEAFNAPASPG